MGHIKKKELTVGAFFLVVGMGYLYLTSQLEHKTFGVVDATFIPYVLAFSMCLLGVVQLWHAYQLSGSEQANTRDTSDYLTVWKTLGLIVAYAAFMNTVGFPIMTVVYLFVQFIVLTPANKKPNYSLYGTIAVLTSVIVYMIFRHGFDLVLPVGLLGDLID